MSCVNVFWLFLNFFFLDFTILRLHCLDFLSPETAASPGGSGYASDAFSGDEDAFGESMTNMMADIQESHVLVQSNEYIIQNDWAFTNFFVEYYSIILIIQCLLFSPFHRIKGNEYSSWFWDEFNVNYTGSGSKCLGYTIGGAIFWWLDSYLYTYGTFKVINAPVVSILDVSDVFFTFLMSYIWLHETPNYLEVIGSLIIISAILICVYPWEKLIQGSRFADTLKNF